MSLEKECGVFRVPVHSTIFTNSSGSSLELTNREYPFVGKPSSKGNENLKAHLERLQQLNTLLNDDLLSLVLQWTFNLSTRETTRTNIVNKLKQPNVWTFLNPEVIEGEYLLVDSFFLEMQIIVRNLLGLTYTKTLSFKYDNQGESNKATTSA